ncbi:response regulator transcription factor [Algoriphagus antarcticus]|uniref:LuxR family two component transcriptional regulator n=1 Tax=Algoriphagus antarcticus TaxID=238540 RepID=A0A3E0DXH3_9BACT|nr:response regulator transcription factor [Algoriphagus antarcticus]REG88693.1 LuxR family two component transcriptional regulator [Algoriphagus antarcticus]
MIRVAVYDDNPSRRESLQALISLMPEWEWAGSFENCSNIIQDIDLNRPDIILMDLEMPVRNGLEGIRLAKLHHPQVKIIVQTAFDDDDKVFKAIQLGAEGYILKSAAVSQITQSIDEVFGGGASMSPSIAMKVMRFFSQQEKSDYHLTPKETEVLKHLANGLSYKMIADQLGISYFTVNNHVKKIYEKLQVHSLGEAVALAYRKRLL